MNKQAHTPQQRYVFNYPFFTDTNSSTDVFKIVPSGHEHVHRTRDTARATGIADLCNSHARLLADLDALLSERKQRATDTISLAKSHEILRAERDALVKALHEIADPFSHPLCDPKILPTRLRDIASAALARVSAP